MWLSQRELKKGYIHVYTNYNNSLLKHETGFAYSRITM